MTSDAHSLDTDAWTNEMWAHELTSPDLHPLDFSTVSPAEIFMGHAPAMTTPTFSSPGLFDSPSEGYDTSPMYGGPDDLADTAGWYSLFPKTDDDAGAPAAHPDLTLVLGHDDRDSTESPDTSPRCHSTSIGQKRSLTAGVRKRSQVLPPIVVDDPSDVVAVKRARNTLAARKSRLKKAERMDEMEA